MENSARLFKNTEENTVKDEWPVQRINIFLTVVLLTETKVT